MNLRRQSRLPEETGPMASEGEIIVYQPNSTLRLKVKVDGTTAWLNRLQMAELIVQSAGGGGLRAPVGRPCATQSCPVALRRVSRRNKD